MKNPLKAFEQAFIGSVKEAVKHYLANNPDMDASLTRMGADDLAITALPAEYDNVRFEGVREVGGKFCYTVGEYKAAADAFHRNNG